MSVLFLPWTRVNNCTGLDSGADACRQLPANIEPSRPGNLDGSSWLDAEIAGPFGRPVPAIASLL